MFNFLHPRFKIIQDDKGVFYLYIKEEFFSRWKTPSKKDLNAAQFLFRDGLRMTVYLSSVHYRHVEAAAKLLKRYYQHLKAPYRIKTIKSFA